MLPFPYQTLEHSMVTKRKDWGAIGFLLPALIVYLSVIVIPVFYSFYISLFDWNGIRNMKFVGLGNYKMLFTNDPIFIISIRNNLIWIILTLLLTMTVALMLAVILNKKFHGRTFFRGFFYFPSVIAPIAVSIIWRWIYEPNFGFINQLAQVLGSDFSQTWLSNPRTSLYAIFAANLWAVVGQSMILFLAGLQTVSVDALEAATIDGAGAVKRFIHITIPYLRETFIIVFATLIIAGMKVFDIVMGLTAGGPNNSTEMLSTYMYSQSFRYNNVGLGTTVACIMVLIMLFIIVPYVSFTAKEQ